MSSSTDIVVVGAGVLGASIAYHLTARGAKVVLIDRGAICSGETAKSGGFVQTHWRGIEEVRLIARSRHFFAEFPGCRYTPCGYLHVTGAEDEPKVRRIHQMLLDEGLESQWLTPAECKRLQPLLRVDDLVGGAYEPSSGWADPVATTRALAQAARTQGAEVREGEAVLQIRHGGGRVLGVETAREFIASPKVVLAAGPWSLALHPNPRVHIPMQLKRGQVIYTNRPGGLPRQEIAFYDELTGLYSHTDGDTNLVGIDWRFDLVWGPDHYAREVDPDYVEAALAKLAHRFPSLKRSVPVRGVVGLYDYTPDGWPILDGDLGLEGYYLAAGFSGAGFKSAPATGLGMAEMVLDGRASSVNLDHVKLARFHG